MSYRMELVTFTNAKVRVSGLQADKRVHGIKFESDMQIANGTMHVKEVRVFNEKTLFKSFPVNVDINDKAEYYIHCLSDGRVNFVQRVGFDHDGNKVIGGDF